MFRTTLTRQLRQAGLATSQLSGSRAIARPFVATGRTLYPSKTLAGLHRCYSTEPLKDAPSSETVTDAAKPDAASGEPLAKELEAKKKEILDLKDRYLRGVADFRNLQERTKRDMQSARDFAIQKFAKDLIESVDNLDRALSTVPEAKLQENQNDEANRDLVALYNGLKMTEEILLNTLKKHGLERFDPSLESEVFDPNAHEATFMTAMEGRQDGTVFMTQQKGFKLNGRILRAAKVGVVKNSTPAS